MMIKREKLLKDIKQLLFIALAILLLVLMALLKDGFNLNSDDAFYSRKEVEVNYEGVFIDAILYFKNNELTRIEGELVLLNTQILDEDTQESIITFWSKKHGYSSTCESLFQILSESHKMEIENQFFNNH